MFTTCYVTATVRLSIRNVVSNKTGRYFVPIHMLKHYSQLHATDIERYLEKLELTKSNDDVQNMHAESKLQ